jgi:hypothetical protein
LDGAKKSAGASIFSNASRNKTLTSLQSALLYTLCASAIHRLTIHACPGIPRQLFTLKTSQFKLTQRSQVRMHSSKSPEPRGQFQRPRNNTTIFTFVQRVVLFLGSLVVIGTISKTTSSTKLLNPFTNQATTAIMDTNKISKGVNDFGNTLFSNLGENVSILKLMIFMLGSRNFQAYQALQPTHSL